MPAALADFGSPTGTFVNDRLAKSRLRRDTFTLPSVSAMMAAMSPDSTDPLLGKTVAKRYRLDQVLGRGGFSTVYRSTDLERGGEVAVKVLRLFSENDKHAARFAREIATCKRLRHACTIRVLDHGHTSGRSPFMVMELLQGRPLSALTKDGARVAPDRVVRIGGQICGALAEAHSIGLIHRDLKPDNIYVLDQAAEPDAVKVLDFGLAKVMDGTQLTATGTIVGTPAYMSPEQADAASRFPIDARADLYSLGVVLYELLAGRPPFTGKITVQVLMKHVLETPPDLARLCPDAPPLLCAAVMRLLSKRPDDRFGTATSTRRHLEAALRGEAPPPRTPPAPEKKKGFVGAIKGLWGKNK